MIYGLVWSLWASYVSEVVSSVVYIWSATAETIYILMLNADRTVHCHALCEEVAFLGRADILLGVHLFFPANLETTVRFSHHHMGKLSNVYF